MYRVYAEDEFLTCADLAGTACSRLGDGTSLADVVEARVSLRRHALARIALAPLLLTGACGVVVIVTAALSRAHVPSIAALRRLPRAVGQRSDLRHVRDDPRRGRARARWTNARAAGAKSRPRALAASRGEIAALSTRVTASARADTQLDQRATSVAADPTDAGGLPDAQAPSPRPSATAEFGFER